MKNRKLVTRDPREKRDGRSPVLWRAHAFSLMEVIAVLAMISIFAAIIVPPAIQQIDRQTRKEEGNRLTQVSNGIRDYVESEHTVPASANWGTDLEAYVDVTASEVTSNDRENPRRYLMHPTLASSLSALKSKDGLTAASKPDFARLIILSSVHEPLPSGTIVTSKSDFESLWDWSTESASIPDRLADMGWNGTVDDLLVEKVNLNGKLRRLMLRKVGGGDDADYTINGTTGTVGSDMDGYVLSGSRLVLKNPDGSPAAEIILRNDESYFLKWGKWYNSFPGTYDPRNGADQWIRDHMENLSTWVDENGFAPDDLKFQMYSQGGTPKFQLSSPGGGS